MNYEALGIMLTRKCNASCNICCISCTPECTERLDVEKVKAYIASTKDTPTIKGISFTGGEPFLYYKSLKELVIYASNIGKQVTVMTNGFWASNYEFTLRRLKELRKIGVKTLGISYDEFHSEFIPPQNIKNILRAANFMSFPISINTIQLKGSSMGKLMDTLGEYIVDTRILPFSCNPVGKAKEHIPNEQFIRNTSSKGCHCRRNNTFTIDYKGDIYPCCSPYIFETQFNVGNYNDQDAPTTLKRLKNNHILYMMQIFGFDYFIEIAKSKLNMYIPEYVISSCELCSLFFSKDNIFKFYPYVYETLEELKQHNEPTTLVVNS